MVIINFVGKTGPAGDIFNELIKEVNGDEQLRKIQIDVLATETALEMKKIISSSKTRPQAGEPTLLENAIAPEFFDGGWGVGDVQLLNKAAPHWAAVNFGSTHLIGKILPPGIFAPGVPQPMGGGYPPVRDGRWKQGFSDPINGRKYRPTIKNPIPAMNYIEKTVFWLSNKFNELRGA